MADAAQNIEVPIFGVITRKIKSLRTILVAIGKMAQGYIVENFETEGSRLGTPWPALSPRYAARKLKKYGKKQILVRDQRLLNSIPGSTPQVGDDNVTVGTEVPYATIHHYGGTIAHAARTETFLRNRHKKDIKQRKNETAEHFADRFALRNKFKKGKTAGRGFTFGSYTVTIPPRPFMKLIPEDATEMGKEVSDFLFRE